MNFNNRDVAYTIISRVEECMRGFINERITTHCGGEWKYHVPQGIIEKVAEEIIKTPIDEIETLGEVLEATDFPHLGHIIQYRQNRTCFSDVLKSATIIETLNPIRIRIAHSKPINHHDFLELCEKAKEICSLIGKRGNTVKSLLKDIDKNRLKDKDILQVSVTNLGTEKVPERHPNNLPAGDYYEDGGFIGRREDITKLKEWIGGETHRVITISGAGGVGKTAIAHYLCKTMLGEDFAFNALVWVSAKKEKLTVTGIESIEPTLKNYESIIDSILESFGWIDDIQKPMREKQELVNYIIKDKRGLLLVIDNLETISEPKVLDFIKEIPPPNKVIITSRTGLGEVERRYTLREMHTKDAVTLVRTVSREKGIKQLLEMPDRVLNKFVEKMYKYPLAIKWVLGQIALGRDINSTINELTTPTGDVAKFCFDYIFTKILTDKHKKVLYCLAITGKAISFGILCHISNMDSEGLQEEINYLNIASLIIVTHQADEETAIETKYELLPLTREYIEASLQANPEILSEIQGRITQVQNLIEEAERAGKRYKYSLKYLGANSEEEKLAAVWAFTGYNEYQIGNYDQAVKSFRKAVEIAPKFASIYRNWATMESSAGFYSRADELMQKATQLSPADAQLWFTWGNIAKKENKFDNAVKYFQKALDLAPNEAPIIGAIADIEKRRSNFEIAEKYYNSALNDERSGQSDKNRAICITSMADNKRRWAEELKIAKKYDDEETKLKEAFEIIENAANEFIDDPVVIRTYYEIVSEYASLLFRQKRYWEARPLLEKMLDTSPRTLRESERKIRSLCILIDTLILLDAIDEAKKVTNVVGELVRPTSKSFNYFNDLHGDLFDEQKTGILIDVKEKGFGFISPEKKDEKSIFIHFSNIIPKIEIGEFMVLKGKRIRFVAVKTEKGVEARRGRIINK